MKQKTIEWQPIAFAAGWDDYAPDGIVWVDVAKLDAAWQRTDQYVLPGGVNGQDQRYERVAQWFEANSFSKMPYVIICDDGIEFSEGRHRFAWLRDRGAQAVQLQVPPDQEREFLLQFGTDLRATVLMV